MPDGLGILLSPPTGSRLGKLVQAAPPVTNHMERLGWRKLAQRPELDLADALAGDPDALADLLQRPLVAVDEPEPQATAPGAPAA